MKMPPHPAQIGHRRQHPDGRRTKRHDAHHFDGIARSAPHQKIVRKRVSGGVNAVHLANLLDEKPQRRVDEVLIELGAT